MYSRRVFHLLFFVIKLALYALFITILWRGLGRWSRRRRPSEVNHGCDGRDGPGPPHRHRHRHRPVPAAGGNRLAAVSELQAIWPDQAAEEDKGVAPALPPSPADDASRLEDIAAELAGVEAALRRLDDGSYGICEACGAPLHPDVLAADALSTRCPHHAG
jgi:hypothetical protein